MFSVGPTEPGESDDNIGVIIGVVVAIIVIIIVVTIIIIAVIYYIKKRKGTYVTCNIYVHICAYMYIRM